MAFTTGSMLLALTISGPATGAAPGIASNPAPVVVTASAQAPAPETIQQALLTTTVPEAWTIDRRETRPPVLPALYVSLAALQVYDVYSTRQALGAGAHEVNPSMRKASGHAAAMLAVKALSTAGTIYFTERAWKKHRKGAILMMAVLNGATAMIAARNVRNAR